MLSDTQVERYSRQIILPQVGGRGQLALLSATVEICGSNAIATTAALYLAAAGVGHLRVSPPTAVAIEGVNPDCHIALEDGSEPAIAAVHPAAVLCAGAGTDTCARMNAACVSLHVPMIVGDAAGAVGVGGTAGTVGTMGAVGWMSVCAGFEPDTPCYSCLSHWLEGAFRSDAARAPVALVSVAPSTGAPLGNVTAGFIGTLMATEAMKVVLGLRPACVGRLLSFDALAGEINEEPVPTHPRCAVCGGQA